MTDLSSVDPTGPTRAASMPGARVPGAGMPCKAGFGRAFGTILADDASDVPAASRGDRQALAERGTPLPDLPDDEDDPVVLVPWLGAFPAPVALATPPVPSATGAAAPAPGADMPLPVTAPIATDAATPVAAADLTPGVAIARPSAMPVAADASTPPAAPPAALPRSSAAEPPANPTADPVSSIVVSAAPQPARAVFAAAIAAATGWRERAAKTAPGEPAVAAPGMPGEVATHPLVQPAAAMPGTALDLGTERGLRQMIDRIETLRDDLHEASDARDTRIRLVPDRLGAVDIAVRRDGDAVRVHFTAEREATQALLVDAQPRLTELAAQRGLRIAEASVSTGAAAQQHDAPAGQRPPPRPARPAADAAPAQAQALDATDDTRLA